VGAPLDGDQPPQPQDEGTHDAHKTSIGLDENLAGALAYALGWITGLALLLIERENSFVRFHALQSTIVFGVLCILWFVGLSIPFLGWLISFILIPPVSAVLWLLLLFKAYQGERFKIPIAGEIALRQF
jgi:uncharacterized membrane protein